MNAHTIGSKYAETQDLDIAEVAKLVRKDLKAAIKAGQLPTDAKFSVRIDRYSMGQSLDVRVTLLDRPARVAIDDPRSSVHNDPRYVDHPARLATTEAANITSTITAIIAAYNYDDSDHTTDYYHVRFSADVTVKGAER